MVDVENKVIDAVRTAVLAYDSNAEVASEYVPTPSKFPHIGIYEDNSYTYESTIDSSGVQHDVLRYSVNVYSNKANGKKEEAKKLMQIVDDTMIKIGFTRKECMPMTIPNMDFTVYRIVSKYSAVVSKNNKFYRR